MPDHPLVKAAKVVGWGWLGEHLGVPMSEVAGNFAQGVQQDLNRIIQENQDLRQKLLQSISSYLQIWSDNQGLQRQLSQKEEEIFRLQKENESFQRRIEELEPQAAAQLQPFPETPKETHLEPSASQWLQVMPDFARCLILGAPGSGKSATGHMLLELHRWKKTPYILGFPKEREDLLPPWIGLVESFDNIPSDSIVLVDEAYLLYHARKSGFDKGIQEMSEDLGLARQRGHSILFVAHEARHLDKNIVGYANLLVIKEPGIMEIKFDRPEFKEVLERAEGFFQKTAADTRGWCYVWSPEVDFEGPLETPLPSYWTEELSRAYASGATRVGSAPPKPVTRGEKIGKAGELHEAGWSYKQIGKALDVSKSTAINYVREAEKLDTE